MNDALLLVVLALVAYRLWRFVGQDRFPGAAVRGYLQGRMDRAATLSEPWEGEPFEAIPALIVRQIRRGRRAEKMLDGLTCPWCFGSWLAFAVTAVADLFGHVPMPGLFAFAVAGLTGLLAYFDD